MSKSISLFKDNNISGSNRSSDIVERRAVLTRLSRENVRSAEAVTTGRTWQWDKASVLNGLSASRGAQDISRQSECSKDVHHLLGEDFLA